MGIRTKILLAFLLSVFVVGSVSFVLLQQRMHAEFDRMERMEIRASLMRVASVSTGMASSLLSLTKDWGQWTDMYDFARQPTRRQAWADDNVGVSAAANSDVSFFEVLSPRAQVLLSVQSDKDGGPFAADESLRSHLIDQLSVPDAASRCFMEWVSERAAYLCAVRITRSDFTGEFVGVLLMGRVFSDQRMSLWQEQLGFPAQLFRTVDKPSGAHDVPDAMQKNDFGFIEETLLTLATEQVAYLRIKGVDTQPVATLTLRMPRVIHVHSQSLNRSVLWQSLLSTFLTALFLVLVVNWVLVTRLRAFHDQLSGLAGSGVWTGRVTVTGRDEIGMLASEVNGLLGVIEQQVKDLTSLSMTDPLTGLANRRAFDQRLALEFAHVRRNQQPLALLMFDVDFFKRYNDHYGHPQGDVALKTVAEVLSASAPRVVDLAARIGGEEFALMLPVTTLDGATDIARRLQQLLAEKALPHAASQVSPYLTVSVGVAVLSPVDDSSEAFLSRTDHALYKAKNQGRNRFVCADDPLRL